MEEWNRRNARFGSNQMRNWKSGSSSRSSKCVPGSRCPATRRCAVREDLPPPRGPSHDHISPKFTEYAARPLVQRMLLAELAGTRLPPLECSL